MKRLMLVAAAVTMLAGTAMAETYPARPVRVVVPTAPGGGVDIITRIVAQKLGDRMGNQFYIDNKPGAGGMIGARFVTAAEPDGYTLLTSPSGLAILPAIKKKMPYDVEKDLAPIMMLAETPYALIVNPSLPVHSVKELIAYVKAHPGKVNYGSAGFGSASHLAGELFKKMAGVDMVNVPNKSMGPAMLDVISGQVSVLFGGLPASLTAEKDGKVRILAVAGPNRSAELPNMPTIAEAALPGYEVNNWIGFLAPAKTDAALIKKLHDEVATVMADPETKAKLIKAGFEPIVSTPEAFASQIRSDVAKWHEIAEKAGLVEKK
jgi:tripartite-type tricarboxylate transporter receptor subunit TctC